jgi:dTDP-4-amino-4,6-dideoxygalactose transaminase
MILKQFQPKLADLSYTKKYLKIIDKKQYYSNFGPLYHECESIIKKKLNIKKKEIIFTSSGHSSLLACMKLLKHFVPRNKKYIILPAFCFYSNPASIVDSGFEPIFCDINIDNMFLREKSLEHIFRKYKNKIAAINYISPFGYPININYLNNIKKKFKTEIIYDAADTFINFDDTLDKSNFFICGSFHPTKNFAGNESGFIITSSKNKNNLKSIINFGFIGQNRKLKFIGFNGKFSEYDAAILLGNLNFLKTKLKKLIIINKYIHKKLANIKNIQLMHEFSIKWYSNKIVIINFNKKLNYKKISILSKKKNVLIWKPWMLRKIYKEDIYKSIKRSSLKNTEFIMNNYFAIPFSENFKLSDFSKIIKVIQKIYEDY